MDYINGRSIKTKYTSTVLHQVWFVLVSGVALVLLGKIDGASLGIITATALGVYGYTNVQKHKLYGNGNGNNECNGPKPSGNLSQLDSP